MLEARDIKKQFTSGTDVQILFEHLNFSAREGEFVVITGRSGSGKSTLLYLLGLLDTPSAGTVAVDGLIGSSLPRDARTSLRLERFGYVFRDSGLVCEMSGMDNVMPPVTMRGESGARAALSARAALERVGLGNY